MRDGRAEKEVRLPSNSKLNEYILLRLKDDTALLELQQEMEVKAAENLELRSMLKTLEGELGNHASKASRKERVRLSSTISQQEKLERLTVEHETLVRQMHQLQNTDKTLAELKEVKSELAKLRGAYEALTVRLRILGQSSMSIRLGWLILSDNLPCCALFSVASRAVCTR